MVRNIYLSIAALLFFFLLLCEFLLQDESVRTKESNRIYKVFDRKEKNLEALVDSVISRMDNNHLALIDWSLLELFNNDDDELEVAVFDKNILLFWSSAQIDFLADGPGDNKAEGLVHLPTGWYYQYSKKYEVYDIRGYLLIKREFPYRNRYIKNSFQRDFELPDDYLIQPTPIAGSINIYKANGLFLFSVTASDNEIRLPIWTGTAEIIFFALVLALLAQLNVWLKMDKRISTNLKPIISAIVPIGIYILANQLNVTGLLHQSELFSPHGFAYSNWLSSLGGFMLLSIYMFHVSLAFFTLNDTERVKKGIQWKMFFSFSLLAFYYSSSVALLKILLLNSGISLTFFSDMKFSVINLYAFFCISLQVIGFVIIAFRLRSDYINEIGPLKFILSCFVAAVFAGVTINYFFYKIDCSPFIYYVLVIIFIALTKDGKIREYKNMFLLVFSIAGASYVNFYAQKLILEKKTKVMELLALKLSSERDPGAETFLSELDSKLRKDTIVRYHLMPPYKSLEPYFLNNYFTGFWRNYNLQITVCGPDETVFITDENKNYPCFSFFDNLRKTKGILVSGSNFYFMDRVNGRISYLGQLDLINSLNIPVKVFIELNSKVVPEGKGYPELLLDEHASREKREGGFSYAKYFDGELVDRGGVYLYGMKLPLEIVKGAACPQFSKDGFKHCAYNRTGNNYVIVSVPEPTVYEWASTLPFLFLIFYLTGGISLLINGKRIRIRRNALDFRGKIQLMLILSLLSVLTIIGLGLLYFNSNKMLNSLQDNLNEKLSSISSDLSIKIGPEDELSAPIRDFMNEQLIVLSDILRTDINLYDPKGRLFATSRTEIYDRGLLSRRMSPAAFKQVAVNHKTLFLHDENLGAMKFLSAYSPVYNQNNQLVGYLNLPYFTKQDDFKRQVSSFIVAFSNLYILLIMFSLIIAIFISQKLTAPLLQIENNLKGIQLGKKNTKIEYSGEDEIGRLAKEYNKKVDELAESAGLLAKSERESAWQEMARQVAHEINNPLTPMKLSIQYLQRLKENSSENFDDYFIRVSRTLVEQIDALSLIASSFSDFTSMPGMRNELIDLTAKTREVVLLFDNLNNISVTFSTSVDGTVEVMADKDQLGRAVINLIKNGIQAIPKERVGVLKVELHKDQEWAIISISDNGSGIPFDLLDKLFEPSFTTKSSGMGLGLAITKRIIENFKGEIWFKPNHDIGTTFYIKLPLSLT